MLTKILPAISNFFHRSRYIGMNTGCKKKKFYKSPLCLEVDDLVALMGLCFPLQFYLAPSQSDSEVCFYCRRNFDAPAQIAFWFTVTTGNRIKNYSGQLSGGVDGRLLFVEGIRNGIWGREIIDDWGHFCLEIWSAFEFFKNLGFFKPLASRPKINPLFLKDQGEWTEIYRIKYDDSAKSAGS